MRAAKGKNGVTERLRKGAHGLCSWSTTTRYQSGASLVLAAAPPLADSPNGATKRCSNHRVSFARAGTLDNNHTFGDGGGWSVA
jgi:hypothetical protein